MFQTPESVNWPNPLDFIGYNGFKVGNFNFYSYYLQGAFNNFLPTEIPTVEFTISHNEQV